MLYGAYSLFGCKLVEKKPVDVESSGFFFYSITSENERFRMS